MSNGELPFLSFHQIGIERARPLSSDAHYLSHHRARHSPYDEYFHFCCEYCPSAVYTYRVRLRSVFLLTYSLIHILIIPNL